MTLFAFTVYFMQSFLAHKVYTKEGCIVSICTAHLVMLIINYLYYNRA